MNEDSVKQLTESFIAYRELLSPLRESLNAVGATYGEIRDDLDALSKNLSGNAAGQLERVHAVLSAQAKSGKELNDRIEEYSKSGERYAQAVKEMSASFSDLTARIASLEEMETKAREQMEKIDLLIEEKKSAYNLKELQRSMDRYSVNMEKISEFINRDVASVIKQNAEKIDSIRKENDELKAIVVQQSNDISALAAAFTETTALLKKVVEGSTVNEQYLFDVLDKWAADRKVKTRQK